MKIKELLFTEENFKEKHREFVEPFMASMEEGFFETFDGKKLHHVCKVNPQEKGAVVFCHGFCEFIAKYSEILFYFYEMGYSVFMMEHRGHGASERLVEDLDLVHVERFSDYVEDLHCYVTEQVQPRSKTGRILLYAHSMGGGIGAMAMERYPDLFEKAVLSSPMLGIKCGDLKPWQIRLVVMAVQLFRWQKRYIFGQHAFDEVFNYENSSSLSLARYEYVFNQRSTNKHCRTYGGSFGWLCAGLKGCRQIRRDVSKITTPILLFQAGHDSYVLPEPQVFFAEHTLHTTLRIFPDSKHEIFGATDEIIAEYYEELFDFLR